MTLKMFKPCEPPLATSALEPFRLYNDIVKRAVRGHWGTLEADLIIIKKGSWIEV